MKQRGLSRQDALCRLHEVRRAMQAVSDLMVPERDLSCVDREAMAFLLDLLLEELQVAEEVLSANRADVV